LQQERGSYDLKSHPICPIALGRLAHPTSSCRWLSALKWAAGVVQSVDHPQMQGMPRGLHDPAVTNQSRSGLINIYEVRYGMREAYQEAAAWYGTAQHS
jgi:hypothetical protein